MAHTAWEIDYHRILKKYSGGFFDIGKLNKIYSSGNMIISDLNPLSFCYPVEYFDGVLIRFYTENVDECIDMLKLLIQRVNRKLFVSHIAGSSLKDFKALGFNDIYNIFGLYKMDYSIPFSPGAFSIDDYSSGCLDALIRIDGSHFPDIWQLGYNDLDNLYSDKNICIRVCSIEKTPVGFSIIRFDRNIGYGYIIRLCVDTPFQRKGIGTALIRNCMRLFKENNTLPVFTDIITEDSLGFFKYNGFKIYLQSHLLVRDNR